MAALAVVLLLLASSCIGKKSASESVLFGKWRLTQLRGSALPEGVISPTLEIDLKEKKVWGYGGCNQYFGTITKQDDTTLELGKMGATRKACPQDQVEGVYLEALDAVREYRLSPNRLRLLDAEGIILLEYIGAGSDANPRLNDIWAVTHIGDKEIKLEGGAYIEINLEEMKITGNNGCNLLMGPIKQVGDKALEFGDIATTMRMCEDMEVPHAVNQALANVHSYQLDELHLKLLDARGKCLLTLRKAD